jgi:hypothetical protein
MKVGFEDDSFAFEFVRNLGFMYYGGADLGEMIATAEQITEGDFESWYEGWHKRAQRTLSRADADFAAGHRTRIVPSGVYLFPNGGVLFAWRPRRRSHSQ